MNIRHYISTQSLYMQEIPSTKMGSRLGNVIPLEFDDVPKRDPVVGFGVAITGSSCYNLNLMQPEERNEFIQHIYGKDGLNLNVARLTIGSSDYSPEVYTYDDVENDVELKHFSLDRDNAYILPMTKEILKANQDLYVFASPWSPPGWMKTGGWIGGGEMRDRYVETYARYIVKYLQEMEKRNIHVSCITPQNEPLTDTNGHYLGCRWHPEIEAHFIHELRKLLKQENMDTGIWMFDHDFGGWRRVQWMLEEDPALLKEITGVALHYYGENIEKIDPLLEEFPDLSFHFTEGGPRLCDNYGSDHCKWAIMISKSFNHGCRSFTGWNLLLDETGGPNIGPFFCGGFATRNMQTGELTYSGQSKAMAHFSKYVQRGAQVLGVQTLYDGYHMSSYPRVGMPVEASAFKNPDGSYVLVLVNPNQAASVSEGRKQIQMRIGDEWYYVALLPDSVSTIVIEK